MYIKKKYRLILAQADKEFTIPNSFQKFIDENKKLHNLIIKSKGGNCYCTCCGNKFIAKTKVDCKIKCPNCKQKLLVKTNRLKEYTFKDNLQLLDKINNTLILRTFELRTYYDGNILKSNVTEFMRTIIEDEETHDYTTNQLINKMGNMYVSHNTTFTHWRARSKWAYRDVYGIVCPSNLKRLFKNTEFKYSQLDKYVLRAGYIDFVECLRLARYHSFEMLIKMKLYNLASDADKFTKGSNFQEIFGVSKTFLPFMVKNNINFEQLKVLRLLKKEDINLINKLIGYSDLEKLSKYVNLEVAYYKVLSKNKYYTRDYLDYLDMCRLLQYDLKDKKILYPENLMKEHDKLVKLIKLVENEQNDKLIKIRLEKLNKTIYQNNKYIIYPAPSVASMQQEANSQKNCLLTYCKRYALGESDIYFLRSLENIDKSLVTVEIQNSKVVQARSKFNEPINKEQEKFLNTWTKKVLERVSLENA